MSAAGTPGASEGKRLDLDSQSLFSAPKLMTHSRLLTYCSLHGSLDRKFFGRAVVPPNGPFYISALNFFSWYVEAIVLLYTL